MSLINNKICTVHVGDEKVWKLAVKLIKIKLRVSDMRHVPETCMSGGQISREDESTGTVSSCRIYEKKVMKHCMLSKKTITKKLPVYNVHNKTLLSY